jgi:starch synthase
MKPKKQPFFSRAFSLLLALTLACDAIPTPLFAAPAEASPEQASAAFHVPSQWGKIEKKYSGTKNQTVILIQDAHAIPEAQESIQELIQHFIGTRQAALVGIEGASGPIDPQIFKSFPEPKPLEIFFDKAMARGELPGALAAAVALDPKLFIGVEDWDLYLRGLESYRAGLAAKERITLKLNSLDQKLQSGKKNVFSKELLELDEALAQWAEDPAYFPAALQTAAGLRELPEGSQIRLLWQRLEAEKAQTQMDPEIQGLALQVQERLKAGANTKLSQEFHAAEQRYQTSQTDALTWAETLLRLAGKMNVQLTVSEALEQMLEQHRQVLQMRGLKLFEEFDRFVNDAARSLCANAEQAELYEKGRKLRLLRKMAAMEAVPQQWEAFNQPDFFEGLAPEIQKSDFEDVLEFYQNALKRDAFFWSHLASEMKRRSVSSAILVTGGFHADSLEKVFENEGISYLRVMPHMGGVPDTSLYAQQMQGHFPWTKYFPSAGTLLSPYEAFVRFARDALAADNAALIKAWRDQIIRDLASQNRVAEHGRYTVFLDETAAADPREKLFEEWNQNAVDFASKVKKAQQRGGLSPQTIPQLFQAHTTQTTAGAIFSPANRIPRHLVTAAPSLPVNRSEVRPDPEVEMAALKSYLSEEVGFRVHTNPAALWLRESVAAGLDEYIEAATEMRLAARVAGILPGVVSVILFEVTRDDEILRAKVSEYYETLTAQRNEDPDHFEHKEAWGAVNFLGVGDLITASPETEHAKGGGMADVLAELPPALVDAGASVIRVTFAYRDKQTGKKGENGSNKSLAEMMAVEGFHISPHVVDIPVGAMKYSGSDQVIAGTAKTIHGTVFEHHKGDLRTYFIYAPDYTRVLYPKGFSAGQNLEIAMLLSRGSLELLKQIGNYPSFIFMNDWMASLIALYLKAQGNDFNYTVDPHFLTAQTIAVGHNWGLPYQMRLFTNEYGRDIFPKLNFPGFHYDWLSDPQDSSHMNLIRAANAHASKILTVSPNYLLENLRVGSASGLDWLFRQRAADAAGISNGLSPVWMRDYDRIGRELTQQPAYTGTNKDFAATYRSNLPAFKSAAKRKVQIDYSEPAGPTGKKFYGTLTVDPKKPLLTLVARLTEQKGIELFIDGLKMILDQTDAQFLIAGSMLDFDAGTVEDRFQRAMIDLATNPQYAGRFVFHPEFVNPRLILLGADGFFMPSKDEPGGIAQLQALYAGTEVIGRGIGGVKNTVFQFNPATLEGNGFLFTEFTPEALAQATRQAVETLQNESYKAALVRNSAAADNLWDDRVPYFIAFLQHSAGVLDYDYPHLAATRELVKVVQPHLFGGNGPNDVRSELRTPPHIPATQRLEQLASSLAPQALADDLQAAGLDTSRKTAEANVQALAPQWEGMDEGAIAAELQGRITVLKERLPQNKNISPASFVNAEVVKAEKAAVLETLKNIQARQVSLGVHASAGSQNQNRALLEAHAAFPELQINELLYNPDAPREMVRELTDALGAVPHDHDLSRPAEIRNRQPGVAVLVSSQDADNLFDALFWSFQIDAENSQDPLLDDYVETLKVAAALHLTDLIAGRPELRLQPKLLEGELLSRLNLDPAFFRIVSLSQQQIRISSAAAQIYLQAQASKLIEAAA